jgi:hypothetical protein
MIARETSGRDKNYFGTQVIHVLDSFRIPGIGTDEHTQPTARRLENGDILYQLAEPADNWVKVRTAEGLEGFVYFSYVTKSDNG